MNNARQRQPMDVSMRTQADGSAQDGLLKFGHLRSFEQRVALCLQLFVVVASQYFCRLSVAYFGWLPFCARKPLSSFHISFQPHKSSSSFDCGQPGNHAPRRYLLRRLPGPEACHNANSQRWCRCIFHFDGRRCVGGSLFVGRHK